MAADLHIHVMMPPMTMDDYKVWSGNHLGSKYFGIPQPEWGTPEQEGLWDRVTNTPQLWIGEVSWLKAGLFGDDEAYVPNPVMKVQEIISSNDDECVVCTPDVIDQLCDAVQVPVQAKASYYETIGSQDKDAAQTLRDFLTPFIGQTLFTVSW